MVVWHDRYGVVIVAKQKPTRLVILRLPIFRLGAVQGGSIMPAVTMRNTLT